MSLSGLGKNIIWGLSPALDIQEELECVNKEHDEELNIILFCGGDARHVLKTMASMYKHSPRKINFYILDLSSESYARQILFLSLSMETSDVMGLQEKTFLFMELYGNSLVRKTTNQYLKNTAEYLMNIVTDHSYQEKHLPLISLKYLKYKEVDAIENILKFWKHAKDVDFDMRKHWELRLRYYLGVRYDSRNGAYDWDYHMTLKERGADILNIREYKKWRETGVAFDIFDEAEHSISNATFNSIAVSRQSGEKEFKRAFEGDIVTGPYIAFGLQCEDKSFYKKANDMYIKRSTDFTERNVLSMFHELHHGCKYEPEPEECTVTEVTETDDLNVQKQKAAISNCKVYFLSSLSSYEALGRKECFQNHFHVAVYGHTGLNYFNNNTSHMFKDGAMVIVEMAKFIVDLRPEQLESYATKVTEMASTAHCTPCTTIKPETDSFGKYIYKKPTVQ